EFTVQASAAMGQHLRVKYDSNDEAALSGIDDACIGTLKDRVLAADDQCTVIPLNVDGTRIMIADGAIGIGDNVYPAASGKVSATVAGQRIGVAVTAATADGDWIEVLPTERDSNDLLATGVNALTGATMTVTAAMCKGGHVTTSHSGAATVNLPAGKVGMRVTITKIDANAAAHTIDPNGAELIQGAATFAAVDAQWDSVTLEYSGAVVGWTIVGKHIS
ncbi:MAG TPA: hypothetical protein VEC39_08430, partial [Vicinamibacterales bacterium]|nr:hypothetical protein [Vicinamibacterales bacterium]